MATASNWTSFAESPYPWERDALEFVRERFPTHDPYRAWTLFEFIALDGSVNEVDLLIFAPYGFFLVEIKSRPGRVSGDAGTWTWETDGRLTSTDNPLKLANLKAKKLADLLNHQSAAKRGGRVPFIEPLIFLSAPNLQCDLAGTGRLKVCLRDREAADGATARPGIMAAIRRRECPGLESLPGRGQLDRPTAKLVARAIEQAGIRQSNRQRHQISPSRQISVTSGWPLVKAPAASSCADSCARQAACMATMLSKCCVSTGILPSARALSRASPAALVR